MTSSDFKGLFQLLEIYSEKYRMRLPGMQLSTRMVQLNATAAIEYVAAGHFFPGVFWPGGLLAGGIFVRGCFCPGGLLPGGTFGRGDFCPGVLLSGGLLPGWTFVRGAYARSPQVQCVYIPSRLSVPSMVA